MQIVFPVGTSKKVEGLGMVGQYQGSPSEENKKPQLIGGRFRLVRLLGRGHFGQVFEAEDVEFDPPRRVALKLINPELLVEEEVRENIKREASNTARFNHPNILRIIDFKVTPEMAYIVSELADGGSLATRIRPDIQKPPVQLPLPEVAFYLNQLADAIDEAHEQRMVHRDLKPQNILLDKRGKPLIADFGLATALSASGSYSIVEASSSGTPQYMAPEQWLGQVGRSSDIYSLGIIVFQMITGHVPFQGSALELMGQHLQAPIPLLSQRAPGLKYPPELDKVIAEVLAKDPKQRTRPAAEFSRRFRDVLDKSVRPTIVIDKNPPPPRMEENPRVAQRPVDLPERPKPPVPNPQPVQQIAPSPEAPLKPGFADNRPREIQKGEEGMLPPKIQNNAGAPEIKAAVVPATVDPTAKIALSGLVCLVLIIAALSIFSTTLSVNLPEFIIKPAIVETVLVLGVGYFIAGGFKWDFLLPFLAGLFLILSLSRDLGYSTISDSFLKKEYPFSLSVFGGVAVVTLFFLGQLVSRSKEKTIVTGFAVSLGCLLVLLLVNARDNDTHFYYAVNVLLQLLALWMLYFVTMERQRAPFSSGEFLRITAYIIATGIVLALSFTVLERDYVIRYLVLTIGYSFFAAALIGLLIRYSITTMWKRRVMQVLQLLLFAGVAYYILNLVTMLATENKEYPSILTFFPFSGVHIVIAVILASWLKSSEPTSASKAPGRG